MVCRVARLTRQPVFHHELKLRGAEVAPLIIFGRLIHTLDVPHDSLPGREEEVIDDPAGGLAAAVALERVLGAGNKPVLDQPVAGLFADVALISDTLATDISTLLTSVRPRLRRSG